MTKTAMQQLLGEIEMAESLSSMNYLVSWDTVKNLIKAKLPIERQQIEDAYVEGKYHEANGVGSEIFMTASDYFTKTYEQ